jgi:hypothetical protein
VTDTTGPRLTLLARAYCHLCDEMLAALRPLALAHRLPVDVVDVDAEANAALEARWGELVPVLFLGPPTEGGALCHYHCDGAAVEAALRKLASPPEIR